MKFFGPKLCTHFFSSERPAIYLFNLLCCYNVFTRLRAHKHIYYMYVSDIMFWGLLYITGVSHLNSLPPIWLLVTWFGRMTPINIDMVDLTCKYSICCVDTHRRWGKKTANYIIDKISFLFYVV